MVMIRFTKITLPTQLIGWIGLLSSHRGRGRRLVHHTILLVAPDWYSYTEKSILASRRSYWDQFLNIHRTAELYQVLCVIWCMWVDCGEIIIATHLPSELLWWWCGLFAGAWLCEDNRLRRQALSSKRQSLARHTKLSPTPHGRALIGLYPSRQLSLVVSQLYHGPR